MTAVRKNPWLRLVAAGKLRKVALIAAMRKLAYAIYRVAKNRRPFELRLAAMNRLAKKTVSQSSRNILRAASRTANG